MKKRFMKKSKWVLQSFAVFLLVCGSTLVSAQTTTIVTDIFTVKYSQDLEQPLELKYTIECPLGTQGRSGISWSGDGRIHTSDVKDYENNEWDRGHLAPAAAFSCDKKTIKKTFTYLNCALQHEGLNRGPWKELERFERDLAKFFEVVVLVEVVFDENPQRVAGGAAIPSGFYKTIFTKENTWKFYFPNKDVAGEDWYNFRIIE